MVLTDLSARQLQTFLAGVGKYSAAIDGEVGDLTIAGVKAVAAELQPHVVATLTTVLPAGLSLLQSSILTAALRFVGLSEVQSNSRWDDLSTPAPDQTAVDLRAALIKIGWEPGEAYCIAGAEVCWQAGFAGAARAADFLRYGKLITLGVLNSYNNLKAAGLTTRQPVNGAIFFAQHGGTAQGHAGIVTEVFGDHVTTIEFNTSPTARDVASDREGDGVYRKTRALSFAQTGGLWLRGFCNPPS